MTSPIILLATRPCPQIGNAVEALVLRRSTQGDTSWHLLEAFYQPPETLSEAVAKDQVTFMRAGSFPTLLHGLVDQLADWGAKDGEIIPLADFIPRLEEWMRSVHQGMVELVQDREVM